MRIIFWGTSDFAQPSLERIYQSGDEILYVVTAPEKHAGRGLKLKPSPVRLLAEKLGLRILEPENPNTDDFFQIIKEEQVDICVLAAYGFIIKPKLLQIPIKGFVNIHPSLLPKYRGAAPIQRTIINGEKQTGVTTFFMNEAMDAGDVILQSKTDIIENETYDELRMRLAQLGADLLIETLNLINNDNIRTVPQDTSQVTIAKKIKKEHCIINWNQEALNIHNLIRGLSSEPGAYTYFRGKRVKIIKSSVNIQPAIGQSTPGQIMVMKKDLVVATQNGYLNILLLQLEGGKVIIGTDFINGQRLQSEEYFK
jgi:methionyl-tRNA formyltransferase